MRATILMPWADQVSDISAELFAVLVKHHRPYSLMALMVTLDFLLRQSTQDSECPPEAVAEAERMRRDLQGLLQAIARALAAVERKAQIQ
jgi:uncharacterized protein YejL (UPF0352 family)